MNWLSISNLISLALILMTILPKIFPEMPWDLIERPLIIIIGALCIYELVRDSPEDRQQLQGMEDKIQNLETRVAKLEETFKPTKISL
ncbi:MAG TPA: hypothetical protein VK203_27665 [Nostocaceae cyanobacterium]|nr:hypothetical protein [Nostocaceae cyanobacterium]